jgi:hypothetical protein
VLAGQVEQGFGRHPDVEIYRSQPGLGVRLPPHHRGIDYKESHARTAEEVRR